MVAYITFMKLVEFLTDNLVAIIIMGALVPVVIAQTVGANWTVTIGGTSVDLTIFLLIFVLLVIVYSVTKHGPMKGRKWANA